MVHTLARPLWHGIVAALLLAGAAEAQAPGGPDAPPPTVTVLTLASGDVTLTSSLPGRVVASGTAEVRPQVNGIIVERLFQEGSEVELGAPLYRIDPATYEAQVAAAKAQVAQAEARLRITTREADRLRTLQQRNVASEQTFEEAVAARDEAAAALQVAQAALLTANIDLDRTTVRAPLAGVIGRSLTTQGALVTSGQAEPLAVIRQLDPVLVDVTQSAAEILAWRRGVRDGEFSRADTEVKLILADGSTHEETGALTAAEPNVNELTGVVTFRLEFSNNDGLLLPGMYVQVELPTGIAKGVILAPQQGVAFDPRGNATAMVVNADNVVEQRALTILQDMGNSWVVSEGLSNGDRIVVEGVQKIGVGMTVAPEERAAPEAAAPEAAATDAPAAEAPEADAEAAAPDAAAEAPAEADPAADPTAEPATDAAN